MLNPHVTYFGQTKTSVPQKYLRHCGATRKVAGSIPDGATITFNRHNPSGRTMTSRLTHPLTELSKSKAHPVTQCFSTAGPRPGTGPRHQLYRAARGKYFIVEIF
jgi:hypothetical protein